MIYNIMCVPRKFVTRRKKDRVDVRLASYYRMCSLTVECVLLQVSKTEWMVWLELSRLLL